jgi:murein DD-endopeptidase MepM/ murein hydrolase activator NlpD
MVRVEVRTMMYLSGFGRGVCFGLKTPQCAAIVFAAIAAAGCSADVARFDSSSFNLNDPPETVGSNPPPQESVRSASDFNNPVARSTPRGPFGAGAKSVEVAALPDPVPSSAPAGKPYAEQSWKRSPMGAAPVATAPAYAPATVASGSGETIDVQPGDTLFAISKRHHVSLAELMAANQMTAPNLKPGQKLIIPASTGGHRAMPRAVAMAPSQTGVPAAAPVAPTVPMTPPSPEVLAKYSSSYTVQPGDSLYKVARANRVNFSELQNVNGITDVRKVKPGMVLKVPAGMPVAAAESLTQPVAPVPAAPVAPRMTQNTTTQPTVINAGKQVASLNDKATDAVPAAAPKADKVATAAPQAAAQAVDSSKLRWPVSGRVIAGFGGRPDGTHNDGINMSVPLGTEVHAAESGVVAYAGSELKGYGNLVLLRHDNGWVTAYAHNDELLVKRGDKVTRGQVIGKAGKTGTVDQPQVHFELRQGSKPVDPTPFMEKI